MFVPLGPITGPRQGPATGFSPTMAPRGSGCSAYQGPAPGSRLCGVVGVAPIEAPRWGLSGGGGGVARPLGWWGGGGLRRCGEEMGEWDGVGSALWSEGRAALREPPGPRKPAPGALSGAPAMIWGLKACVRLPYRGHHPKPRGDRSGEKQRQLQYKSHRLQALGQQHTKLHIFHTLRGGGGGPRGGLGGQTPPPEMLSC